MNTATIQPITTKPATTAFWAGFDEYCKGARLEDMPTADHKRGWWHANQCEGDTFEYVEDIADRTFWARGGW